LPVSLSFPTRRSSDLVISSVVPNPDLVWRRIERALAADAFTPLPRGSIHLTLGYCPSARKARKVKRPEGRAPVPIRVGSLNTSEDRKSTRLNSSHRTI